MPVLIAGSKGKIGKDLLNYFRETTDIVCLERRKLIFYKKKIKNKKIIINKNPFNFLLNSKLSFSLCVNCVAVHDFSKDRSKKNFIASNVFVPRKLVQIINKQSEKSILVNLSTIRVSELKSKKSFNNKSKFLKFYAETKKKGELEIKKCKKNYVNLRLPGVITSKPAINRPWLSKIINLISKNKNIKVFNSNKPFNNFIDSYEIFLVLLHLMKEKKIRKTLEISASKPHKLKELLFYIIKYLDSYSQVEFLNNGSDHKIIDNRNFINKTGIKLNTTMHILKRILKYYD